MALGKSGARCEAVPEKGLLGKLLCEHFPDLSRSSQPAARFCAGACRSVSSCAVSDEDPLPVSSS